jgi:hypothetical protein
VLGTQPGEMLYTAYLMQCARRLRRTITAAHAVEKDRGLAGGSGGGDMQREVLGPLASMVDQLVTHPPLVSDYAAPTSCVLKIFQCSRFRYCDSPLTPRPGAGKTSPIHVTTPSGSREQTHAAYPVFRSGTKRGQ